MKPAVTKRGVGAKKDAVLGGGGQRGGGGTLVCGGGWSLVEETPW